MHQISLEKNNNDNLRDVKPSLLEINVKGLLSHESLLNTLTLTERQEVAKSGHLFRNKKVNINISAQLNQSPFNDSYLLAKWYKKNNLNEEKLRHLHCNEWLGEHLQKEYFTNINEAKKIEERESPLLLKLCLNMLLFILPEINSALMQAESKLKDILDNKSTSVIDIDLLILAFCPQLLKKLKSISRNSVRYFNENMSLTQSNSDDYRCKLFNQFPMLLRQISQIIEFWLSYITEFSQHLKDDIQYIENIFFGGKTLGQVSSISNELGDTHNQGRYAFICNFSCGNKIAYKPRSLALDNQFYQFLDFLSINSDMPVLYKPAFLCRKSYGWMEYIDSESCEDESQVEDYFFRSGCLLSVLYLLEAEDIHFENVIARKNNPVVIDLETLFHLNDDNVTSRKIKPLHHTVLKTHLIPQYDSVTQEKEPAAIISVPDINAKLTRGSLPILFGNCVSVNDYNDDFVHGFEVGYKALLKLKNQLPEQLKNFAGLTSRYIARPTRVYSQLWKISCQAYHQQSGVKVELFYEKLWVDAKKRPFLQDIIENEREALVHCDIPILNNAIGSRDLHFTNGKVHENYFKKDSYTLVLDKFSQISMKDCAAQIKIIRRSLALGISSKPSIIKSQLLLPNEPSNQNWQNNSAHITKKILAQAVTGNTGIFWPVFKIDQNDSHCLDATNYRLCDGVLGLLLSLAYSTQVHNQVADIQFIKRASHELFMLLRDENFDEDGCGAFDGLGGVIYVISHLYSLWQEQWLLDIAPQFIAKLSKLVLVDHAFDIQAGSAGAILSLLSYYKISNDQQALEVSKAFGDQLLSHFTLQNGRCGWVNRKGTILTGFAHGSAGISYALMNLYQVSLLEKYKDIAIKALVSESSNYCRQTGNWLDFRYDAIDEQKSQAMSAWCNGAMGIGYSRLLMLGLIDDAFDCFLTQDIERAIRNTLAHPQIKDHGLCHGHFGNQEFILQWLQTKPIGEKKNYKTTIKQFIIDTNSYLSDMNINGFSPKSKHFESLGLMNGLAGINYQLLKYILPEKLPSLLMLQPPIK